MPLRSIALLATLGLTACAAPLDVDDDKGESSSPQAKYTGGERAHGTVVTDGGVNARVRSGPGTSFAIIGSLAAGSVVGVACQTRGETINGNDQWDYVPSARGYVSDALMNLGGVVVPCGDALPSPAPASSSSSSSSALGTRLVAEARQYLGSSGDANSCNAFTPRVSNDRCRAWCSDFVNVVWRDGGADTTGITGASISFYEQAVASGRWKDGAYAANVQPGDAVIWANSYSWGEHVGMVTGVSGDSISVIHGNFENRVHESTISRSNQVGTGANILGYASPRSR